MARKPLPEMKLKYFEYEGYLVSKPELPYVGTNIFQDGEWRPVTIANGDTALFPMSEADADDIVKNGYGKPQSESLAGGLRKSGGATNYRHQALNHYKREVSGVHTNVCVMCGFGLPAILEVAHLDQNRKNNSLENLALLCPNCHKMHDIGLIPPDVVKTMRDKEFKENWALRIKDAGSKAASTKLKKAVSKKRAVSASKAWETRRASVAPKKNGD